MQEWHSRRFVHSLYRVSKMKRHDDLCAALRRPADAVALIRGSREHPDICGRVLFYQLVCGVIVRAEIAGLPENNGECENHILAFHIHEGEECSGNETDAFAGAKGHYNPKNCPHPYHAGDMPPLFSVRGRAYLVFLTDRFSVREILDKTVIVHTAPDDFMTQPSGNAGTKIACGIINKVAR